MIDRKKVEKAINIANVFERAEVDLHTNGLIRIYVWGNGKDRIDKALKFVSRLENYKVCAGEIWARATVDGIELKIAHVDWCEFVDEPVEEPEMAATGKMVTVMKRRYVCPEDVK